MKWRALAVMLTAMTITSSLGVVSGTLAWFAYTTRASISFEGTTVHNSEQLQIGFRFETGDESISRFKTNLADYRIDLDSNEIFEKVDKENNTYFFVKPGTPLSSNMVSSYSRAIGHATNELIPVTSREYILNDDSSKNKPLRLNRAPTKGEPNLNQDATKDSYSRLDLAFRVLRSSASSSFTYVKKRDIWLKDCSISAELNLTDSIRLFLDNEDRRFILNPKADKQGETTVAGLLNMDYNDDYYDYDPSTYFKGKPKELIYGDYTLKEGMVDNASLFEEDSEFDDINNTQTTNPSSFLAKHQKGIYGYENLDNFDLKKAMYYSMDDIKPSDNAGYLSGGRPVCTTSNDEDAIAELSITIYLEGWDHSITNDSLYQQENSGTGFDLGLTFQTNRVD